MTEVHAAESTHGQVSTERWVGVGSSSLTSAREAGAQAADRALQRDDAELLIVFCSDSYELDGLLGAINHRSGGVSLIGCSTAGEIATDGPADSTVVVAALGGDGFSARTTVAENASRHLREAGAKVGACFADLPRREHEALVLLSDGLAGDQQEIVRGAYGVLGAAIPLVGGCAGDGLKMKTTYQFHDGRVFTDAVVGAALGSDAPLGIGVRHGWRKVGEPMIVTGADGNRVRELDDEPALDVYLKRLDAPRSAFEDAAAFTQFALTHPLGLNRRSGEDMSASSPRPTSTTGP